jgi:hypothetical protein
MEKTIFEEKNSTADQEMKYAEVIMIEKILFADIAIILFCMRKKDQIIVIISKPIKIYEMNGFISKEYGLLENISPPRTTNSTGKIKTKPNK